MGGHKIVLLYYGTYLDLQFGYRVLVLVKMKNIKVKLIAVIVFLVFIMMIVPIGVYKNDSNKAFTNSISPYTFIVASDGHWGYISNLAGLKNNELINVIDNLTETATINRIFDIGDLCSNAGVLEANYISIKAKYDSLGIPYHVTSGNHDSVALISSVFSMPLMYYTVIDGDFVWIVVKSDIAGIALSGAVLAFLEDSLDTYSDKLCFILMHINQQQIVSTALEVDYPAFGAILQTHKSHIGSVILGHIHDPNVELWPYYPCGEALTYEIEGIRYTYAGTYGSDYNAMNPPPARYSFLNFRIYDMDTYYRITSWREDIINEVVIEDTYSEYDWPAQTSSADFPNSDVSSLWIRRDGSDPGFEYDGANVSPAFGMNYFGTNVIQVHWSYNFSDIANPALFPIDCEMYIQVQYDAGYIESVADLALTDSRIKGVFIDDFEVSSQSPANMTSYYNAIHHNDAVLGFDLTLGIIVYNRNYFDQTPYTWESIKPYFDIIHFWFYPFSYTLLYEGLAGYEDDFMTLHSWMPEKEYWLGIYLHYYNLGSYPADFSSEQLSIAGKLIKKEYATRFSILENFWIQHNTETSVMVRDFINNEFQMEYSSNWWYPTTVFSFSNGSILDDNTIINITRFNTYYVDYGGYVNNYTFESTHLQNLTVYNVDENYIIYNMRTGKEQYPFVNGSVVSFIVEPNQVYRIRGMPLTDISYSGYIDINTPTVWSNLRITINGTLHIHSSLEIYDSIILFGNDNFTNSMFNATVPNYGIYVYPEDDISLVIWDSIIEPSNRAFPYFFNRAYSLEGLNQHFHFDGSAICCYAGDFRPAGYVYFRSNTFFQVQPNGENYFASVWFEAPSYIVDLNFENNLIWNYDVSGSIGVFIMPYYLQTIDKLDFKSNTIVGGNYGLWIDMTYSDTDFIIEAHNSYSSSGLSDSIFTTFRLNGEETKNVTVTTSSIHYWSVKNTEFGPAFTISYIYKEFSPFTPFASFGNLENGVYQLTIDDTEYMVIVTNQMYFVTYSGPWLEYRNNFSFVLYSLATTPEESIDGLIWLLIIFLLPIILVQTIPKLGFIIGMFIMLLVVGISNSDFIPYMIMSFGALSFMIYKNR
jgi:hypothetical protein